MKTLLLFASSLMMVIPMHAQNVMTPQLLWQLGRVSAAGVTPDGQQVVYHVTVPDAMNNTSKTIAYAVPIAGGAASRVENE